MSVQPQHRLSLFIQKHQATWNRLESLIELAKDRRITKQNLDELGHTYRRVSAHLAYAQTYFPEHPVTRHLNTLTARGHQAVYAASTKSDGMGMIRFFSSGFPALFHERSLFFLIAMLIFTAGGLWAFGATIIDERNALAFLPPEMVEGIDPAASTDVENREQWDHAVTSGAIMQNNIKVAFLCFALGALLGIGTLWVLFMNGMLIGALAALFHRAGESYGFWALIWPHGVLELAAIFIAGAAGLSLAWSFWVPGELTRIESFKREAKVTGQLVVGVIPLFVIAALIEGFITPAPWPHWTKYMVALITLVALILYFGRSLITVFSRNQANPGASQQ
ncbi:stage II sporulation protein M [Desmospora activa]|uniref:Putative membrane protein SpoIIM required for sporulation n=1 Tax=Desmospora activa DSM 45169 TaxID=1121389 RepID=A0A2T4ZA95_9BACL|nr:stage II sporulation protein M [Desmospora activa]PTM58807.1 putative membrane protein SpoIIM required for sporulation [Desmospora activa DSM 45169]